MPDSSRWCGPWTYSRSLHDHGCVTGRYRWTCRVTSRSRGATRRAVERAGGGGGSGGTPPRGGTVSLTRIGVGGERPYEVVVGTGAVGELPSLVGPEARMVVVIHPAGLGQVAPPACRALRGAGVLGHYEIIPDA